MKKRTWTCSVCGAEHRSIAPPTVCGAIQNDGTTCDGTHWGGFPEPIPSTAESVTLLTLLPDSIFRLLLDLFMASDPWPLANQAGSWDRMEEILNGESESRGFGAWTVAYHEFKPAAKPEIKIKPAFKIKAGIPEEFLENLSRVPLLPATSGFLSQGCLGCIGGIRIGLDGYYCGFGKGPRLPLDSLALQIHPLGSEPYRHKDCPRNAEAKAWKKVTETEIEIEKD